RLRQEFRGAVVVLRSEGGFARDQQNGNSTKIDELARRISLPPTPEESWSIRNRLLHHSQVGCGERRRAELHRKPSNAPRPIQGGVVVVIEGRAIRLDGNDGLYQCRHRV